MERFGVFETVRVEKGKAVLIEYHYRRIRESSRTLSLPFDLSPEEFEERITEAAGNGLKLVRFTLFRSGKTEISVRECRKRESVSLLPVYSVKRVFSALSLHKTVDVMDSIYALEEAKKAGYDEALLFDEKGFLSEAAFANLFFYRNGILFTPSLKTGCLPGTRREFLRELCREIGLPLIEGFFTLKDLLTADEVFITSAREDICPVRKVGQFPVKRVEGKPLYQRIKEVIEEVYSG